MVEIHFTPQPRLNLVAAPLAARAMHLVDVENLLGGTSFSRQDVTAVAGAYAVAAQVGPRDQIVIASSHNTAAQVWFGWGEARRLVRSGPDGADLALLEVIDSENLAGRFERVVIGSGDKIFAHPAARLQAAGVKLAVVTRPDSLSRQLRLASRDIRFLKPTTPLAASVDQRSA